MSTPLASKTTISSRNKMNAGGGQQEPGTTSKDTRQNKMQPPSLIARNRALQSIPPVMASSRLADLANGFPSSLKAISRPSSIKQVASTPKPGSTPAVTPQQNHLKTSVKNTFQPPISRLAPHTTHRLTKPITNKTAIPSTSSRVFAPHSRISNTAALNSRSSSVLSSVSSSTASKRLTPSSNATDGKQHITASNHIPDTVTIRKGLAKFSNPIECQRQYQAQSLKIRQLTEIVTAREKEIDELQDQLKRSINLGVGYATAVQYFALKLKLDSDVNLLDECEQLKCRVDELMVGEREFNDKLNTIVDEYKSQLLIEQDLKNSLTKELEETRQAHSEDLKRLNEAHQNELDDLIKEHSAVEKELSDRIEVLESELRAKCKELADLSKEHELLNSSYNKLEESLTKDKDARVKYAQEKINQLQKDVDSLNSVLEMRTERIHALEKDSILLVEVQNELMVQKDNEKALNQQIESLEAAMALKRSQLEKLMLELEQVRQELKKERKERRRMTEKTEQLEYVLDNSASCAAENTLVYSSSMRDLDSADHLV